MRDDKMAKIPPGLLYSRHTTMAFSLEFMGDSLDTERTEALQEENGSIGVSPSATSYFLTRLPNNVAARRYVADIAAVYGSTAPEVFPFDVFETAWSLWNLGLAGFALKDPPMASLVADLVHLWERSAPCGLGFSSMYSASDADDTAMVYSVLRYAGYEPPSQVFGRFERDNHFVCYPWERDNDSSLSVNIHVLHALQGLEQDPTAKIVNFLRSQANSQGYWRDKWHISPFYTTGHAVIALVGSDHELARGAVQWILDTQRPDGGWGYYDQPTAEETAYCLQALSTFDRYVKPVDRSALTRGRQWLLTCRLEMPALWVGKCLYTPVRVVESAIYSALVMTRPYRRVHVAQIS
jgi:halimadienyl-diphosphate synthase